MVGVVGQWKDGEFWLTWRPHFRVSSANVSGRCVAAAQRCWLEEASASHTTPWVTGQCPRKSPIKRMTVATSSVGLGMCERVSVCAGVSTFIVCADV